MRISRGLPVVVALLLGLTLAPTATQADPGGPPDDRAGTPGRAAAEKTLAEVEALLDGRAARGGAQPEGQSLTLALRDLFFAKDALSAADQARVAQILARPAATGSSCATDICVHWPTTGNDAPDLTDANLNGVPDYMDRIRTTVQQIHTKYVGAGYREPKSDGSTGGGSGLTDIYVEDIGDDGLYGYCTADDGAAPAPPDYSLPAYCVLDDDYDPAEFPINTPIENMQVTAAHEYFHAVQYAYDAYEDGWILESTAAWVEDEVFDGVDDNRQYLANSPMRFPTTPIDYYGNGFHYGTWIFWRYLTEKYRTSSGGLPTLVRDVWRRLDSVGGAPDDYSVAGLKYVLGKRGTTLPKQLSLFSAANRHPKDVYDEGGSSPYKPSPAGAVVNVTSKKPNPSPLSGTLDHLSSVTVRYTPKGLTKKTWKLKVSLNLQNVSRGGAAVITVYKKKGKPQTLLLTLKSNGAGAKTVPFSNKTVTGVDVTLVNASSRYQCWFSSQSPFACSGRPLDDGQPVVVDARAVR